MGCTNTKSQEGNKKIKNDTPVDDPSQEEEEAS